ncbi:replicative DNA helicase [Nannocystis bainbridge]|uniref:DNA 5'-3' helicase n=1 Tax=Nannocystis bainbridge TaxID=2995303 RepID=A0ABT5E491_9BACT|nr:DnaB-like helicase C-terminal domain-containing protein [Nannocystis bainbridge]MDC0720689.1 DnaB-like helicase C-terminal domain-containing protein [Nannocystis bainbridge]
MNASRPAQEAERVVLASVLVFSGLLAQVAWLRVDDFEDGQGHREIWGAVLELAARGVPIDVLSVEDEIRGRGEHKLAGRSLARLGEEATRAAPILRRYAAEIRRRARIRRVREAALRVAEAARDPEAEPAAVEELLAEIGRDAPAVAAEGPTCARDVLQHLGERWAAGPPPRVPFGFPELDKVLGGGMEPGNLYVLGARPRVGKTALAIGIACDLAVPRSRQVVAGERPLRPVLFFSLEMTATQLIERALARESRCDLAAVRSQTPPEHARQALADGWCRLGLAPFWIDDRTRDVAEIRSRAMAFRATAVDQQVPPLIVIDYLQKARSDRREQRYTEIGDIARALKDLAKAAEAPVLALAQVNRMAAGRADQRPTLEDLREGGDIEAEADFVGLLHRPELTLTVDATADKRAAAAGLAELRVAKNRHGPEDLIKLAWIAQQTRFAPLERRAA